MTKIGRDVGKRESPLTADRESPSYSYFHYLLSARPEFGGGVLLRSCAGSGSSADCGSQGDGCPGVAVDCGVGSSRAGKSVSDRSRRTF